MPRTRLCLALVPLLVVASATPAEEPVKIGDRIGKAEVHRHSLSAAHPGRLRPEARRSCWSSPTRAARWRSGICRCCKRWPTITRTKDVQFVAVNAAEEDSLIAMATQAVQHDVEFPFVKDLGGACASALGVRRTPEVVVLDGDRRLRYRGRIDDQYRLGGVRDRPTRRRVEGCPRRSCSPAGRSAVAETEVDGCPITFPQPRKPRNVTFAEHVAPILQKHCWQCHQPRRLGPVFADDLQAGVGAGRRRWPRSSPTAACRRGSPATTSARSSTAAACPTTSAPPWSTGCARGRPSATPAKVPAPPAPPKSKWLIGEPDLVLEAARLRVPATGDIPYKYALLPHLFTAGHLGSGRADRPGQPACPAPLQLGLRQSRAGLNGRELHHRPWCPAANRWRSTTASPSASRKAPFWACKSTMWPPASRRSARSSVGLRFPRAVVQKQLPHIQLTDHRFAIPPGAPAHKVARQPDFWTAT